MIIYECDMCGRHSKDRGAVYKAEIQIPGIEERKEYMLCKDCVWKLKKMIEEHSDSQIGG